MAEIRSINALRANRHDDNTLISPAECLEDVAEDLRSGASQCNKLLVLALDTGDGGDYDITFAASNMHVTEMIALLEVAKATFLDHLRQE